MLYIFYNKMKTETNKKGMNEFKQISTTKIWKIKKEWNIDNEKEISDVKKLHYGFFNSGQIIAFTSLSIKNNEFFFIIHEKNPAPIHTAEIIHYLIKKATVLKITKLNCFYEEKNSTLYEQFGFKKFYSSKYAKQLFSLNLKKVISY